MRRAHVNYATCPYFDPATVTEATGKLNSVLAIMIYHRHHQVSVFRVASRDPMKRDMQFFCSLCESIALI